MDQSKLFDEATMKVRALLPWLLLLFALPHAGCGGASGEDAGLDAPPPAMDDAGTPIDTGVIIDAPAPSDAPIPSDPCATVGETRVGPCGRMCGQASQRCNEAHVWEDTSACLMEGECPRGTSEMRPLGMCGEETRLCQNDCTWTAWERSRPDGGDCRPGQLRFTVDEPRCGAGRGTYEICADTCTFEPGSGTCTDGCGDTARTTPEWAREVCVPAGLFVRGWEDAEFDPPADVQPEALVYVSAFYVDVYSVTVGRFRACNTAGTCLPGGEWSPGDFSRDEYPYPYTGDYAAEVFCDWDGGRRLLTEAEWEKAFRGPAPSRDVTPFGRDPNCDLFYSTDCGYVDPSSRILHDDPYDGLPGTRGFFGTYRQYGGGYEWVAGEYAADYYSDPESRWDPVGAGPGVQIRGMPPRREGIIVRRGITSFDGAGIRCGRSGEVRP